jgi:FG-GAP-like repeat
VGDLNLDGRVDVIANTSSAVRVFAGLGNSNFTLNAIATASSASGITDLAVADFDNDGRPDVAAAAGASGIYLYKGSGNGSLAYQTAVGLNGRMRAADLDNDGFVDLSVVTSTGELHTARGTAAFAFAPRQTWAPGRTLSSTAIIVDRINTDTSRDVVVLSGGEIWTYLGVCR